MGSPVAFSCAWLVFLAAVRKACSVAQLPVFGLLTLIIGRSRSYMIGLVAISTLTMTLSSAGLQWILLVILISAPPLIWFSYRHWCRAEML